jgi:Cof subfamily protein (haloacid dehalogenase superfamily)
MMTKDQTSHRPIPSRISLVLSDVDGTLVTSDKKLTPRAVSAARALRNKGIPFTVASSRPPFGLKSVVGELGLDQPFASFNGGFLGRPDGEALAEHWIPTQIAAEAIHYFEQWGFEIWAFTAREWLCRDSEGAYVAHEMRTVSQKPTVVKSFDPFLDALGKIVAVSADRDRLAQCEAAAQARFGDLAGVARSQAYYLDVTHPEANKASALKTIAAALGAPLSECVAIGDGVNDLGMLQTAGFGIAMGNGVEALRAEADYVTASNEEDGFARAIEHILKGEP